MILLYKSQMYQITHNRTHTEPNNNKMQITMIKNETTQQKHQQQKKIVLIQSNKQLSNWFFF